MSVKRDTLYNLLGAGLPALVSLVTVPVFLHLIGNARYGVLAIVWVFFGYFGVFDPGITRAAAFHIARLHAPDQAKERESVFWTALAINLFLGVVGGVVLYFIARPIFLSMFKMPESMRSEVIKSLPWMAAAIPISIVGGVLGGALQARIWFGYYNSVRTINAVISQLAPLAVAYWHGPDLAWLIPTVLIARILGVIPSFLGLIRAMPLGVGGRFDRSRLKTLFLYGGWVTATNLASDLLNTLDRFVIGSLLDAEAVAFYTVPFNLVNRLAIVPGALSSSLFPKLSRGSEEESGRLASDAVLALAAVMTPLIVLVIGCLPVFMQHWVGDNFARHAVPVGVVLLAGIWINSLAFIPSGHLQASDRPDVVAKFHVIELLPFVAVLWIGLHYFGLVGAAYAWTLRVIVDAFLQFFASRTFVQWQRLLPGVFLLVLAAVLAPTSVLSLKTGLEIGVLAFTGIWSWSLSPAVRSAVSRWVRVRVAA
jgi:O-antigen/teichoic acid export membrane protein